MLKKLSNSILISILLTIPMFLFIGCTRKYNVRTASSEAIKTLKSNGFDSVKVTPVVGCYIIKKPFFMTFTTTRNDTIPLVGVIGCGEGQGCEFRVFVDIEEENTKEELEENTDIEDSI